MTPTEELFMEALSARARLGEPWWTYEANATNTRVAKSLESQGLITMLSAQVERTFRAALTPRGKAEWLTEGYTPPILNEARALLMVAADSLHDTAEGLGQWDDATEYVEYANDMVRHSLHAVLGRPDLIPGRYRDKAARVLERERMEGRI
ncbi:helix-turn-helix DNA binding domain protein [Gordonia phage Aleemily]|uniref:Helix-turn-helix DNA binding domain protein n=1 Tax=Gordonia phage Aleemily TaxID=2965181 RepID=A0A9E7QCI7_9CAUD|nr:helix-turn-helix DNA binding domain protein [Gordonia phage Aleemily]